jgi:hypothetical protein
MPSKETGKCHTTQQFTAVLVLFGVVFASSVETLAQDQVHPTKKPIQTKVYPELVVLGSQVVEEQWKATLDLVNEPSDLRQVEPGQCVKFGVPASGDDRDHLLASAQLSFEFNFADHTQRFTAETAEAIKRIKPVGGDFVTEALSVAGVKSPSWSMASIAASRAQWCVPPDAKDGTASIRASVLKSDGKNLDLKTRSLDIRTFETARKNAAFKDMESVSPWIQHYHTAPDPAQLLPGLRIIASDEKARSMPNIMVFFVEALKANPAAANDLLQALPTEVRSVRIYSVPLLLAAHYDIGLLMNSLQEDERAAIDSVHLPDAFDMKPDRTLPNRMDMLWAVFFATGKIEPVRTVASMLAWRGDYDKFVDIQKSGQRPTEATESIVRGVSYNAAGWSLAALSQDDGLLADYIEALRASPNTSADIKKELANLHTNPAFRKN